MTFKYPIEIARDLAKDISILSLQSMEVHGIGLVSLSKPPHRLPIFITNYIRALQIEKLFDVACTLTDVIACVPLDSTGFDMVASDYLNQLLNLISQLRGGGSRFLPLLLAKVSENLPLMATPPSMPQMSSVKQESLSSPTESSRSAPLMHPPPISPMGAAVVLTPSYTDPLPGGPSPEEGSTLTNPWATPQPSLIAPVPRSVPRVPFDEKYG